MSDFNTLTVNNGQVTFSASDTTSMSAADVATTASGPIVQAVSVISGYNLGSGTGIFSSYNVNGLTVSGFRSLVPGTGVTITSDNETITLNSNNTDVLGQLTFFSVGGGASVFNSKVAADVNLRSLTGSGLVAVQETGDTITISAAAVSSISVAGSSAITVTGSPVTSTGTISLDLSATGVTAGTYENPTLTVDAKGRVTAISSAVSDDGVTVIPGGGMTVSAGPNYTVALTPTGVASGSYVAASIIVDTYGRVTAATSNTIPGPVSGSNMGAGSQVYAGASNQVLSFRGITGSGAITVSQDTDTLTISTTADGTVTNVNATGTNGIAVSGGPISTSGTLTIGMINSGVLAGTFTAPTITVDQTGRITSATSNPIGQTNTASNLGSGYGLFAQSSGVDLQFKSVVAGDGITISASATSVSITAQASCATNLTAMGTSQGNALMLTADFNEILTSTPSSGVMISGLAGQTVFIANFSANTISVYPVVGGQINALATNSPFMLTAGTSATFRGMTSYKWYT